MAVSVNQIVTPQTPKFFNTVIGNGDASAWKFLKDNPASNLGAGVNGTKFSSITAAGNDSSSRVLQLAMARAAVVTVTIASPGVFTLANHGLAAGDQVVLQTTGALPTGLTAGTTYFVIAAGLTSSAFEVSATAGGSAVNTSGSQSGVHTMYIIRPLTAATVAITGGTDGTTAATNFLGTTLFPGCSIDNDGNPYIFVEAGDFLAVSCTGTVTANKLISVSANAGNF